MEDAERRVLGYHEAKEAARGLNATRYSVAVSPEGGSPFDASVRQYGPDDFEFAWEVYTLELEIAEDTGAKVAFYTTHEGEGE